MKKLLQLNLDHLYGEGYYYTHLDMGDAGHSITIEPKDKEEFLDSFAAEWRKKAAAQLEEIEDWR